MCQKQCNIILQKRCHRHDLVQNDVTPVRSSISHEVYWAFSVSLIPQSSRGTLNVMVMDLNVNDSLEEVPENKKRDVKQKRAVSGRTPAIIHITVVTSVTF